MKKNQKLHILVYSCLVILLVIVSKKIIINRLGMMLLHQSKLPQKLDVIMSFAGDRSTRDKYAKTLIFQHNNAIWILSGRNKNQYMMELQKEGVDTTRILFADSCKNTLEEVLFLKGFVEKNKKVLKVALVSSPLHMKRIHIFINKLIRRNDEKVKYYYLPTPYHTLSNKTDFNVATGAVIMEWAKIIFYFPRVTLTYLWVRLF